jgi:hypothetical protein
MAGCRSLILLSLGLVALSSAHADYSLQDLGINVNGTVTDASLGGNPFAVSGVNSAGFNSTTGLGTLTYTFNPGAAGTYFVDFFLDPQGGVTYYNEYGIVGGSAAAGTSYQIDDSFQGTIFNNFEGNTFDNSNDLPGTTSNYANACGYVSGGSCNGDVALGLGFSFSLTSTQEAVITLGATTTNPGGFYLDDVHPVDPNNAAVADYFLQGSESTQSVTCTVNCGPPPPPPPTPEPAGEALVGGGVLLAGVLLRKLRRKSNGLAK